MYYYYSTTLNLTNDINTAIGEIIKVVQYIEWNLLNRLGINTFAEMTLGQIVDMIRKSEILPDDKVNSLEKILGKRNHLIHQYFKRLDFEKHSDNLSFLDNQKKYLNNFLSQAQSFNSWLCK